MKLLFQLANTQNDNVDDQKRSMPFPSILPVQPRLVCVTLFLRPLDNDLHLRACYMSFADRAWSVLEGLYKVNAGRVSLELYKSLILTNISNTTQWQNMRLQHGEEYSPSHRARFPSKESLRPCENILPF